MKHLLITTILCTAILSYGQGRGQGASGHPTGPPVGGAGHSDVPSAGHGSPNAQSPGSEKRSSQDVLNQNTKLSSNLQKLLPANTTPQQACSGFKNLGQCVAAIHVSHNLGISFSDLRTEMTGANAESLGDAIHKLKPDVDAKAEKKKAEKQAHQDLANTES